MFLYISSYKKTCNEDVLNFFDLKFRTLAD